MNAVIAAELNEETGRPTKSSRILVSRRSSQATNFEAMKYRQERLKGEGNQSG